jgi:hypothetical protein
MTNQNQNQDPLSGSSQDPLWILSQDQDPTRYAIRDARNPIREMDIGNYVYTRHNQNQRNRSQTIEFTSKNAIHYYVINAFIFVLFFIIFNF